MKPQDFVTDVAGRPVKTATGYWAFIPAPLPPDIRYDASLALLLSQADAALSELSGLGRYLPNPRFLIGPYARREAVASSRIEGTQAELADVLLDEVAPALTPAGSDVREVRNYVAALDAGVARLAELPLSCRLVRELHAQLMKGVRGQEKTPGEFRRSQNWIGPPGSTLSNATYVPPPHDPQMLECLSAWERFLHERDRMPELIQCALVHEHFEAIHPFLDGNGRVGRLLITLFLVERGRLSQPLLYVSSYIERRGDEYRELLQRIRTHGQWDAWLRFFLEAVRHTARAAIAHSQYLLELHEELRKRLEHDHKALALLDELFVNPYTTVALATEHLGVTAPTAARTIESLERAKIVEEITGRARGRVWRAQPILAAITRASGESDGTARSE